jgi:hypothetical protein
MASRAVVSRAGANARAKTRAKRATAKRRVNKRELEAAAQETPQRMSRHAKRIRKPGEHSDGARRTTLQSRTARGGRERAERRGQAAIAKPKGAARHSRARPHGSVGRRRAAA